jgi:hypothetical protein
MEEILASIRKIISEDSNEAPAAASAEPAHAEPAAAEPAKADSDVLELTHEVEEEPVSPPPAPAPAAEHVPEPAPEPVHAAPEPEPAPEPDVVFVSHEETTVSSSDHDDHGIFSEKSRKAIDDAFAGLDEVTDESEIETPRAAAVMPAVEGDSVQAVFERAVRTSVEPLLHNWMDGRKDELLNAVKPMIREWMDEHFPALLEGAVRDEVARVVKARGRR